MNLTMRLRQANPVPTTTGMSERGRADLAALLGGDEVPDLRPASHRRRLRRWLAAGAAVVLVAGGITCGLTLPGDTDTVPPAWAGPIAAPVVQGTLSPLAYDTSMIIDIPIPEEFGHPGVHWLWRLWLSDEAGSPWQGIPASVTLQPIAGGADFVTYLSADWPIALNQIFTLRGPQSSACGDSPGGVVHSGEASRRAAGLWQNDWPTVTVELWLCRSGDAALSLDEVALGVSSLGSAGATIQTVSLEVLTTDPDRWIDRLGHFRLSPDGRWIATPEGESELEDPAAVAAQQNSLTVVGTTILKPIGRMTATGEDGRTYSVSVTDDLQCTITGDVEYAAEHGFRPNPDGTCSYEP